MAPHYSVVDKFTNRSTLLIVRVDSGISLIVYLTHPLEASGKLGLQKVTKDYTISVATSRPLAKYFVIRPKLMALIIYCHDVTSTLCNSNEG